MFTELAEDNLNQVVQSHSKVVVQYGAGWCGNCRLMKPKFKRMAEEHPEIEFVYVDAEKLPESRKLAEVNNLPTFASFQNGGLSAQVQTNKFENLKNLTDEIARA